MKTNLFLMLLLVSSCGKVEQVQDSFAGMISSNDLRFNDLRIGSLYRSPGGAGSYDYLEFENTQYRIGTVSNDATSSYQQIPTGVLTPVYFRGNFAKRSGISSGNPSLVFDVVDINGVTIK